MNLRGRACAAMLILTAVGGCGYRFSAAGAPLPGGVTRVCAPMFLNHTAEPGLELVFTEALRTHLVRVGTLGRDCGAQITGEIVNVWGGPTAFSNSGVLASYRIYATVHLRLMDGKKVLANARLTGSEDYLPAAELRGDILTVEANRDAALRRLAESLSRDAYQRLATGW